MAIGGPGQKNLCRAYLKDLNEGKQGFSQNVKITLRSEIIKF